MDLHAELVAVLGEAPIAGDLHSLADVVQDVLNARLEAHRDEPQPVLLEHPERLVGHVALGVAAPGHPPLGQHRADQPREALDVGRVVGEGVVVEEELLELGEVVEALAHLRGHVLGAANAEAMPLDGLRPQAEGAAREAAAARVEGEIRVESLADLIVLDAQVALVDVGHVGQRVHVHGHRTVLRVDDAATLTVAETIDLLEAPALGDLLDRVVELAARHEVDALGGLERSFGQNGDVGAHEADHEPRVRVLERLRGAHVRPERGGARVEDGEFVVRGHRQHVVEREPRRRRVHQLAALDHRRRMRQPGGKPEGADLAPRLVASPGAAVEPLERRGIEEERLQHPAGIPRGVFSRETAQNRAESASPLS